MARRVSRLVKKANEATSAQLARDVPSTVCLKDTTLHLEVKRAPQLTSEDRNVIWNIADTNMRDLSSGSSMGWDEDSKKKELFDPVTSRFIIVRCPTESPAENAGIIAAFVMFKFEYDEGERLLYCYELQVAEAWRNCGVGRFLMAQVVEIACRYKMEKVMLTVLKANQGACRFYSTMGFAKDESCPDYVPEGATDEDVQECDYDIMSYVL